MLLNNEQGNSLKAATSIFLIQHGTGNASIYTFRIMWYKWYLSGTFRMFIVEDWKILHHITSNTTNLQVEKWNFWARQNLQEVEQKENEGLIPLNFLWCVDTEEDGQNQKRQNVKRRISHQRPPCQIQRNSCCKNTHTNNEQQIEHGRSNNCSKSYITS